MEPSDPDEDFDRTFLGLDFSTQQLKAVIVDEKLRVRHSASIQFDTALPEFRTHNGVTRGPGKHVVTAPVLMWVKALDILLDQLRVEGADFGKLAGLSGTGQQHGTVYWNRGARACLQHLDPAHFLHSQLASCFSLSHSPVWMDASTTEQCRRLEEAVGGAENLAKITGSVAYERFSGAQISKVAQTKPGTYENTERISLVSSFACSLFLGDYAPIDWSDGSGMNLLDITTKQWCPELLEACGPDLAARLGTPVPCTTDLGQVHEYYVERFGFNPECRVTVFTGDNPSSLAGMCLQPGDLALSLGTSDTLFLPSPTEVSLPQGHVLVSPVARGYMLLLCFKNGSLTRERVRDHCASADWDIFNTYLEATPRGNFGNMGIYYDAQEILPFAPPGDHRYDKSDSPVPKFSSPETEIRALVEGQFLAKRVFAERLALGRCTSRILATGGGASNRALLQVMADIFNAPVYTLDGVDSANLGAAYRAKHCYDRLQAQLVSKTDTKVSSNPESLTQPTPSPTARSQPAPPDNRVNQPSQGQTSDKQGQTNFDQPDLHEASSVPQNTSSVQQDSTESTNETNSSELTSETFTDSTESNNVTNSSELTSVTSDLDQKGPSTNGQTEPKVNELGDGFPNGNVSSSTEPKVIELSDGFPNGNVSSSESHSNASATQAFSGEDEGLPSFFESTACAPPAKLLCSPYPDASKIYDPMVERFRKLIEIFELNQEKPEVQSSSL